MEYKQLSSTGLEVSRIALGCGRVSTLTVPEAKTLVGTALEQGVNFFDHADAYGNGQSEAVFAEAVGMSPSVRDKVILQSKCAIRGIDTPDVYFDQSREHILEAVPGSLKRLKTDYLDILLLHRPDPLAEPEEIAEAFAELHRKGMVRHFGVSNYNPMQMELLRAYLGQDLVVNQMQFNPAHTPMIDAGLNVNMTIDAAVMRDGGTIEYCRLHDISMQAWSPFQYGLLEGVFVGSDKYPELNKKLDELAKQYDVSPETIVVAWILRHPGQFQVLSGSMKPARLLNACKAVDVRLSKMEWYQIYKAAGNKLP